MTTFKLISNIFIWTLLTIAACSTTTQKIKGFDEKNIDTTYSASTKQLRSDKIPDSVFQMTNLRHLSISGEDCDFRQIDKNGNDITQCWMIKEIPVQIKNLKELTTLRLTLNAIVTIPNELTQLKKLKLLDLTDNSGLTNVDNIAEIQSLEYVYLYGCGLTKLPNNIGHLENLKELGLVGNHLDKMEQTRIRNALPNCDIKF